MSVISKIGLVENSSQMNEHLAVEQMRFILFILIYRSGEQNRQTAFEVPKAAP